jgi:hypothetical protein
MNSLFAAFAVAGVLPPATAVTATSPASLAVTSNKVRRCRFDGVGVITT